MSVTNFTVESIPRKSLVPFVEKHHYSHNTNGVQSIYHFGLYGEGNFGLPKMIGAAMYAYPSMPDTAKKYNPINPTKCLELRRLVSIDNTPKNTESYFIGQTFKWLKQNASNIKMLISYADPEQMHLGTIYQATNWSYQDCRDIQLMPNYSVSLGEPHKWIHSRTVFSRYGSHNVEHLKNEIGHTFYRKREAPKHRYLYFLGSSRENKKMRKQLKHDCKAYPKNKEEFIPPIEKHEVENTNKTKSMEKFF